MSWDHLSMTKGKVHSKGQSSGDAIWWGPSLPQEIPNSPQASEPEEELSFRPDGPILNCVEDYRHWASCMKYDLRALELDHFVDRDFALYADPQSRDYDPKKEADAMAFITSRLGEGALDCIQGIESLQDIWTMLEEQYLETNWVAESRLISRLIGIKYIECDSMDDYVSRFLQVLEIHSPIDRRIDDTTRVYLLLAGLDKEHADWVWESPGDRGHGSEPPRFDTVIERLLHQEQEEMEWENQNVSAILGQDHYDW